MPETLTPAAQIRHDLDLINRHLGHAEHTAAAHVDACRLLMRYPEASPGAEVRQRCLQLLQLWGISSVEQANAQARIIWTHGFRPDQSSADGQDVGSGADVNP